LLNVQHSTKVHRKLVQLGSLGVSIPGVVGWMMRDLGIVDGDVRLTVDWGGVLGGGGEGDLGWSWLGRDWGGRWGR
jgi:hypothetical protein